MVKTLIEKFTPLTKEEIFAMDAYFRAANYLAAAQIYLMENPLLHEPLKKQHIKPRLLGHWGTSPGLNFIYAHLNRLIKQNNLNMIFITGPGHGAPAILANVYLEGTYTEFYPHISQDKKGLREFFKQFSFPGGIPSHTAPETPGSINEGGELGYSLAHAFGAVFDNPNLIAACVVGDGEAETGALATSWHSNKFLNPKGDGVVLPILHLNGYKIANPTVLARIPQDELIDLFRGYGYNPYFLEGDDPLELHSKMASLLDHILFEIQEIKNNSSSQKRPIWPMLILKTPKGWTGPKEWNGMKIEGTSKAHQVPLPDVRENSSQLKLLEEWLKSYKIEELFDKEGKTKDILKRFIPHANQRMGANPHANGGLLLRDLNLPDFRKYAIKVKPGKTFAESATILGNYLKDVMALNLDSKNFRLVGPDETASNHLQAVLDISCRTFEEKIYPWDDHLAKDGRVMEILSEHMCQGWLEGYLLTGRHGFFSCYEAFVHIVDSMFNQFAKWLKVSRNIPWRRPIASLNYFLTSHVWRQDHNGFSHQDPGFIDHVVNKKAEIIRVYLPPDANTLLSVADHALRSRNYINLIIAGKHPAPQYLSMEEAIQHASKGIGIWPFASTDYPDEPDVVMASCGDIPTMEVLASIEILMQHVPDLKIRMVNVIDLMVLQPKSEHPHGLSDNEFDDLFTTDKPVIFNFHGYPWLIHRLTYKRKNHDNFHVRGYKEEGSTTTAFDMCVRNQIDRFNLAIDVLERVSRLKSLRGPLRNEFEKKLSEHKEYIRRVGEDLPEIKDWKWTLKSS